MQFESQSRRFGLRLSVGVKLGVENLLLLEKVSLAGFTGLRKIHITCQPVMSQAPTYVHGSSNIRPCRLCRIHWVRISDVCPACCRLSAHGIVDGGCCTGVHALIVEWEFLEAYNGITRASRLRNAKTVAV